METLNINTVNTYNTRTIYSNAQAKEPVHIDKTIAPPKEQNTEDQTNKSADTDGFLQRHYNFKKYTISFSLEKDLNVIVTVVKDPNTKKVVQQIPTEEAIRRMKFINNYFASHPDNGRLNDAIEAN